MMNTENLKGKTRQTSDWRRRMIAFVSALTLLISSCGLMAFAESNEDIYSDPVTAPIPAANTSPEPEEGEAEATPAPEGQPETGTEPQEETGEGTEPEGEPEVSDEPEDLTVYEPGTLTAEADGVGITVDYTAEARVPEGAVLTLTRAAGGDLYSTLKSASKVLKTEEDATWKSELGEDAVFYAIALTNPEGNEIHPETGVTLTCTNLEIPAHATGFVTGENAENLDWKDTLTVDFLPDAIGYAYLKQVQIGTVTLTHEDRDYMVTAAYGPDAGFPADTELMVREILPGTPEYALYSGMTDEALNEDWAEITLERYFDIAFIANGEEMEPKADVDVQIVFRDKIEQNEETEVAAVHIENNEANVIEADTDSIKSARHDDEAIDTVTFTSDSFSVYGVVQKKKIITKVLAADGNTYEIEISYTQEAEIPEESQVKVEEIPEGSDLWEAYRKQTAAALNADDVRLPGLYDISIIDAEGAKVEPKAPVSVSIKLANAETNNEDLHVVHFTEEIPQELVEAAAQIQETAIRTEERTEPLAEEDQIKFEKITATVEGETVSFDTNSFSVYAFAYTVDFHHEGVDYSIPGESQILLSKLIDILNIRDHNGNPIDVKDVESVEFSNEHLVTVRQVSGLISYNDAGSVDTGEKDFLLTSREPFTTEEKLLIHLADGSMITVGVTDSQETTDLNKLVKEVSITTSSGESVIEDGNRIITTTNETYTLKFVFQETEALQYDNYATLVYHVPEGVVIKNPGVHEFDVTIGTRVITGNTYEIVTYADGTQEIRFRFNTAHKNFRYINTSPDLEITRILTAEFTNTTSRVEFGTDGTFGYSTLVEDRHNAKVAKIGRFDSGDRKMHYKAVIQSEYGDSENIRVKDILSGSALTNAAISSIYYSDAAGNYSGNYENGYTDNQAQNGFDITLNKVEKDRCVTVEYTADVDFTKIANNGNAIFSETGNTVNITVPGDSDTSDNTATHEEKGILYSSVTKVSTATSDVQEENGRKFRIVSWKVTANPEQMVSLGGSNITDKLLNNNEVEYYGNGITVTKVLGQTRGTPTEVTWADAGVTDLANDEFWAYPVADNDLAAYEITYQTKVDITDWTQGRELVNAAKTKYAEDTAKVYINPPPQGQETIEETVSINKSATTVGAETITWKIAVNIPANKGYIPLVIEDTIPTIYNAYSDYVESVSVDGEGITEADYTYRTTEKWAWVNGEQVRIGDDKLTITFHEIAPAENNRTINITVVTRNNPDWMEQAETREDMAVHKNTAQVFPNGEPGASDTDEVSPKQKGIIKTYQDEHQYEYYRGVDAYNNPIKIATVPIYRFTVTVTGVDSEPVEINELFDSSIFELLDYQATYNSYSDYLDITYGNYSWQGNKTHKAYIRDGKIILDELPRTDGNAYYGYYNVTVYLYVKPEKLDDFKALIAEKGTPVPGDNITAKQYTFTNVAEWDGARDTAEFSAKVENLLNKSGYYQSETGKYHYTITFNPDKLQVNRNINYDLTDTLRGAIIDRNSISVTATAADGLPVTVRVYDSEAAAANDTAFEGIQVVYPDNATTLSIYEIPDRTSIAVSYDALPSGEAAIDVNANKAIVETGNTVSVLDYTYSVSDRHEYDFISKTKTEGENNSRTFTIDLNPAQLKVNAGNAYELTDTYSGNLTIEGETAASTFTVTADPATTTVGGETVNAAEYIISYITKNESTYSFMIPDQVHVTISYTGKLDFQTGADGSISAHYKNTARAKDVPVEIEENIESRILTKNAGELAESGYIPFEIVFNPLGQILNGNETIELKDSYTNLLVDYSSIRVSTVPADRAGLVEYDYSGTVGTYHVPDGTKIILTYRARPDFSKSTTVEWSNTVTAAGYQDGKEGTEVFSSDGSGRGSLGNLLWLYKYEEGHMERPLNNVTFELYMDVNGAMTPVTRTDGSQVTFTTGNDQDRGNGYVFMSLEKKDGAAVRPQFQEANGFKEDTIYYLKETVPAEGYYENEEIHNFVLHEGQESTYNKPSYKSGETIYLFGKEDIVKVKNTKITGSIAVSKKWINADGTTTWPDGIQNVTARIQKKTGDSDPADMTGENVPAYYRDSESNQVIPGADGSVWNDTVTLTASNPGAEWKNLDDEEGVTYVVTETAVNGEPVTGESFTISGRTYEVITGAVKNGRAAITNAEKTSVSVTKEWAEGVDASEYSVRVKLIQDADGEKNEAFTIADQEKTLNSSGWTVSWSDLPTVDSEGRVLTYDVEETGVYLNGDDSTNLIDSFTAEKEQNQDGSYTITNTPEDNGWHLDVMKTWKDENDQVFTGDSIQFQLIRTTAGSGGSDGGSDSGNTAGIPVNVYVRNDHNAGESNIGLSLEAIPGSTVRFSIDGYTFDMGGYSATEYLEVYYWDTVSNPNWHHWHKIDSYGPNGTQVDITVVDSNMCILLHGNEVPEAARNAAHISLVSLQSGSNGGNAGNAGSTVMKPNDSGDGYETDSSGNYTFTVEPGQTVRISNLPYRNEDGTETYTYTVRETTTGDFTTTVTYSDGTCYNPAPASEGEAPRNGTAHIVNKITRTQEKGSLKITKQVTAGGEAWTDDQNPSPADGVYTFRVYSDSACETQVGDDVSITIINGQTATAEVGNLTPGTYYVKETDSDNKAVSIDETVHEVTVEAGVTGEAVRAIATITNDYPLISIPVTKIWKKDGSNDWPEGVTVTVGLYRGTETVKVKAEDSDESVDYTLQIDSATPDHTVTFTDLPQYDADGTLIEYSVAEAGTATDADGKVTITTGAGEDTQTWLVLISGNAAEGYTILNTQDTDKIQVVKRWYDAYGNYEKDVTIPVTVDIFKIKNGSTEKIYENQSIIPGETISFQVDDPEATYYAVEKDTPAGFRARYTSEALDQSTDMSRQNLEERFLGQINGADARVSSGGTVYIMNTPPQKGGQIETEKKWIEFNDPNGQQGPRHLDGANTTETRKRHMMIRGRLMYDAYDREGNRLTTESQPATEVFDLWTSLSGKPFTDSNNVNNTIFIRNLITDGWTCLINKDNNSIWLFSEYTGSGWENGVSGQLPASGYMDNKIVDYRYHFVETGVYDVTDWEKPADETDEWWVTWVEENQYLSNPSDRTTIVNRKKHLGKINIEKTWADKNLDAQAVLLKVYRYVWNAQSGTDVTSEIREEAAKHGLTADDFTDDGNYIKVQGSNDWRLTIDKLPLGIPNPNGADQLETCYYYIQEAKYIDLNGEEQDIPADWTVSYSGSENGTGEKNIGGQNYILAAPRAQNTETLYVSNTIPTGEITVTKQWKDVQGNNRLPVKDEEKTINFKLFYTYEGETEQTEYTDGREEGQEFYTIRYTPGATVTDQDGNETQGQGAWSEFRLQNLPIYRVIINTDGTKAVRKVAGYSAVEQTESGASFTVTYKVGNGDATEGHSTPVLHGDVTIINTDTDISGKIHVSKTFSGIGELPESFRITARWSEDESPIELTVNDEESRSVEGLTVTRTSVPAAEGTDASYTWTIEGLPIDTTVTFTEDGYSADGYTWAGTVSVNGGEAASGTSGEAKVTSEGENVAFTNIYTAGVELPATGGSGTLIYTVTGIFLITLAGVLLVSRKRKANR